MKIIAEIGRYLMLMKLVFTRPERTRIYYRQVFLEIEHLGIDSLWIVVIISIFMGAVVTIQTAFAINSPLIPLYAVGFTSRQSIILEFSPTIVSLILAGKVGSRIASEIGTMKVTEQVDALEIMGINSAAFLILPKIVASMLINPILIVISMFVGIFGGWMSAALTQVLSSSEFIYGAQYDFHPYDVMYALIKTVVFAYLIASISGYHGYYTEGGALEVGRASTRAVVHSSIAIIFSNLILTQLLLA
jgi:phospholipid/cholesterol/gamma-HCH transport system permease protein